MDWHYGRCDRSRYRNRERIIGLKNDVPSVWIEYDANVWLDRMRGRGERYQYDGCIDRPHSTPDPPNPALAGWFLLAHKRLGAA